MDRAALTFDLQRGGFRDRPDFDADGSPVLGGQVLEGELVRLRLVGDGVDLVGAQRLVVQQPLQLLVRVVHLAGEGGVAVLVHLGVGQVLGDLDVSRWSVNRDGTIVVVVFIIYSQFKFLCFMIE